MRESNVLRSVWLAAGRACTLFRVNTGKAWVSGAGKVTRLADGSVIVPAARPVALGFGMPDGAPLVGASDLCGWKTVIVTSEMVGKPVAVFCAVECKTETGKVRPEQVQFIKNVQRAGGIAGFVRCAEDVSELTNTENVVRLLTQASV